MNAPLVVQFLRNGGTLADLASKLGITSKRHSKYPNLVLLKYDQLESPMGDPIVRECRGIIPDEADNWKVIARSFDKFFNYGETHAAEIDWSKASVQEKVDGSLMTVYAYDGTWHVSTTGTPDASGAVHDTSASGLWSPRPGLQLPMPASFAEYFWQTCSLYPRLPFGKDVGWAKSFGDPWDKFSWMFELTGPLNRVVVPHTEARITLLAARCAATGKELSLTEAEKMLNFTVPAVRSFPLVSVEDIMRTFGTFSPLVQEGYVISDGEGRMKVKHPGYVAIHHAKDGFTTRNLINIVKNGEVAEVFAAALTTAFPGMDQKDIPEVFNTFPDLTRQLEEIRKRFNLLVQITESDFATYRHLTPKKAFAIAVKDMLHAAALFKMYDSKVTSAQEYYATRSADQLMYLLGYTK